MVFSWVLWKRGRYKDFKPFLDRAIAAGFTPLLSFATVGELYAGAAAGNWGQPKIDQLEAAIRRFVVLPFDIQVVRAYGPIQARLADQLKRGGRNDMWTAACALSHPERPPIVYGRSRRLRQDRS